MENVPLTLESLAARVRVLEHRDSKNSEDHGKFFTRIENVEKGQSVASEKLESISETVNEIKTDVKAIREAPAKKWDTVVLEIIKWLALAALGVLLGVQIGG